jgi:hypothetical protein
MKFNILVISLIKKLVKLSEVSFNNVINMMLKFKVIFYIIN